MRVRIKDTKLGNVFKQIEQGIHRQVNARRLDAPFPFDLNTKYPELFQKEAKPATDWACKLGTQAYILYICIGCKIAPLAPYIWLRWLKK